MPLARNSPPNAMRSTASAAPATTSTSASARSSSSTPSTASTCRCAPEAATRAAIPFRRLHQPAEAPLRGGHRHLPRRAGAQADPAPPSPARWPPATAPSPSRRWPTRCAAACAPCAATSGCSAPAIRPTTRCACAPNCCARRPGAFPILRETTPVRMDLTHSGWSDIFFLGMDFPEGARVLNVSIDLRRARPNPGRPSKPSSA